MKAITFNPQTDEFILKDLPKPQPGPKQVLVKVRACGLNPVDAKIIYWKNYADKMSPNWVPGLDVSGEIVALGSGVSGWKAGDKVLYHGDMFMPSGGCAEYALHWAETLLPHPDLGPIEAAATPCAGWTAWGAMVKKLRAKKGQSLFINGGAGGVGSYALLIAKYLGLSPIITTCSPKNFEYVQALGADFPLDYGSSNWTNEVKKITGGRGVDLVINAFGGPTDLLCAETLAHQGEMVDLVETVRPREYKDSFDKCLSFHQFSLGSHHRYGPQSQEHLREIGREFMGFVADSKCRLPEITPVSLDRVPMSMGDLLRGKTRGKIVLTFN